MSTIPRNATRVAAGHYAAATADPAAPRLHVMRDGPGWGVYDGPGRTCNGPPPIGFRYPTLAAACGAVAAYPAAEPIPPPIPAPGEPRFVPFHEPNRTAVRGPDGVVTPGVGPGGPYWDVLDTWTDEPADNAGGYPTRAAAQRQCAAMNADPAAH